MEVMVALLCFGMLAQAVVNWATHVRVKTLETCRTTYLHAINDMNRKLDEIKEEIDSYPDIEDDDRRLFSKLASAISAAK